MVRKSKAWIEHWSKQSSLFCNAPIEKSESNGFALFKERKKIGSGKKIGIGSYSSLKKSGSDLDQKNVIGTSLVAIIKIEFFCVREYYSTFDCWVFKRSLRQLIDLIGHISATILGLITSTYRNVFERRVNDLIVVWQTVELERVEIEEDVVGKLHAVSVSVGFQSSTCRQTHGESPPAQQRFPFLHLWADLPWKYLPHTRQA